MQAFPPALQLNVGRSGAALLSATRGTDTATYVEAAYRPNAQGWQAPHRVFPGTVRGAAAEGFVRRGDRAVVVWRGVTSAAETSSSCAACIPEHACPIVG